MNITEQKAYRWLQYQGYKGITFRPRLTPDFVTEDGRFFEAKKARNNTIWFSLGQFDRLISLLETTILVFDDGDIPLEVIPFAEIKDGQSMWKNIHITSAKPPLYGKALLVSLGAEEQQAVKNEAEKLGMPASSFIRLLIKRYFGGIKFEREGKVDTT